jgi:hypothetical protein
MKYGKTIKLFLIDGEPGGRMTCELSNWTGKAYKIPRIKVKDCTDRSDLNNPGIYLLFGKNEEGKDLTYIGEAETVLKRLFQHLTQKDFWHEAIMFISKDENLNKAHIKYLENRLHDIAKKANRYSIENTITPTQSSISESDRAEMEEFIDNVKILVNTLGHKVFEEKREIKNEAKRARETFNINGARGAVAQGEPTTDGFVVLKGSLIAGITVPSFPDAYVRIREQLQKEGIVREQNGNFVFTEDYVFTSPSAAAMVVMGRSANGLTEWKLDDGRNLKQYESNE